MFPSELYFTVTLHWHCVNDIFVKKEQAKTKKKNKARTTITATRTTAKTKQITRKSG